MNRKVEKTAELHKVSKDCYNYEEDYHKEIISLYIYNPDYNELQDSDRENLLRFASSFEYLETLDVSLCDYRLSDLSFLKKLKYLKRLTLDCDSQFENLQGFLHLTELESLYVESSQIKSVEGIENLKKLQYLAVTSGQLKDINSVRKLSGTLKSIDFNSNRIEDISWISSLRHLEYITFSQNNISEIPDLSNLLNLKEMNLYNNKIGSITNLKGIPQLLSINLSDNLIKDIENMRNFKALENIYVRNNMIGNISALSKLVNLINLDISHNQIKFLSPLKQLSKLNYLSCNHNPIEDLNTFAFKSQLKFLYANQCGITRLDFLQNQDDVRMMELDNNCIDHFPHVTKLEKLVRLSLRNNRIEKSFPIENFPLLQEADLSGNPFGGKKFLADSLEPGRSFLHELSNKGEFSEGSLSGVRETCQNTRQEIDADAVLLLIFVLLLFVILIIGIVVFVGLLIEYFRLY
ncbi:leucine-rich repeat domain-containing protein [uncultured Chryseobacterium sp.]|uniref:leucine-rich repeat domain-containing protein n=1 Tax=uncultured Chryseobacterium sp. TaxID=259322 RepID=UPI0025E9BC66|nr:leucine-rich repeat domain-containing protein [uncultured Chryseobacterium sp.]